MDVLFVILILGSICFIGFSLVLLFLRETGVAHGSLGIKMAFFTCFFGLFFSILLS